MGKKLLSPKIDKLPRSERVTVERYKGNYTTVYNDCFYNKKLSWKATGLLYTMLSLHPDWDYTIAGLATLKTDGIDSTRAGLLELERYGYVERFRCKDERGLFSKNFYKVYECPERQNPNYKSIVSQLQSTVKPSLDFPTMDNPSMDKPTLENPTQLNTKEISTQVSSTKQSNTHSLTQQAAQPQFPAMPEQEGMSEIDSIEEIEDEICRLKALPYTYKSNPQRMEAAIHYMTEWNTFFPAGFNDDLWQRVYNLFNEALIEMCCADKPMTLKGSYVTYAKVIDKLNQLAEFGDYYVDLSEFSEPAMDNFIRGAEGDEIRNPLAYMKSCIWDAMQTGNVNLYADLRRSGF